MNYDAFCLLSYGGPEGLNEVVPFLDSILAGKRITPERRILVEERYKLVNGHSPLKAQCRQYLRRLHDILTQKEGQDFPIFWGNLHTSPTMADTALKIATGAFKKILVLSTAPFDIPQSAPRYEAAFLRELDRCTDKKPDIDFLRSFYLEPNYLRSAADALLTTLAQSDLDLSFQNDNHSRLLLFSFHSIPEPDAVQAHYYQQAKEHVEKLISMIHTRIPYRIVFQSQSGRPQDPWIGPSINAVIASSQIQENEIQEVIVVPSGFFFENMETCYDLDIEVQQQCRKLNLIFRRVPCAGLFDGAMDLVLDRCLGMDRPEEGIKQN